MRRGVEVADPFLGCGSDGAMRLVVGRLREQVAELGCTQGVIVDPDAPTGPMIKERRTPTPRECGSALEAPAAA